MVDVFCNEAVLKNPPSKFVVSGSGDDDIEDACIYHVQLEHAAGCATFSFVNFRRVIGALLIFIGVILTYLRQKS